MPLLPLHISNMLFCEFYPPIHSKESKRFVENCKAKEIKRTEKPTNKVNFYLLKGLICYRKAALNSLKSRKLDQRSLMF